MYDRKTVEANDLCFNPEEWAKKSNEMSHPHTPKPIGGEIYNFDDVM